MPGTEFVGREKELQQLLQRLVTAGTGHGQVVFVAGEAGAGKSTLVKQVTVSLRSDGPLKSVERMKEAESLVLALPGQGGQPGGDHLLLARIYYWLGHAYLHSGDPGQALHYMNQVLTLAKDSGDGDLLAVPTNVVGRALVIQGQIVRGAEVLAQAATLLEQTANWPEWAFAIGMHGMALAFMGNPKAGAQECERALARSQEIKSQTEIAHAYMALSLVAL